MKCSCSYFTAVRVNSCLCDSITMTWVEPNCSEIGTGTLHKKLVSCSNMRWVVFNQAWEKYWKINNSFNLEIKFWQFIEQYILVNVFGNRSNSSLTHLIYHPNLHLKLLTLKLNVLEIIIRKRRLLWWSILYICIHNHEYTVHK